MERRGFLFGSVATLVALAAPAVQAGILNYNHFAVRQADLGLASAIARVGDTWASVFGDTKVELARYINRQNLQLEAGQVYLVPSRLPALEKSTLLDRSPLPESIKHAGQRVIISPEHLAWGYYSGQTLVKWGPAVCGGDFCADVNRACRSPVGRFRISEFAGPDRRSSRYPRELAAEGKGALMPWFMRLTDYGVGMHARYIRGRHETHGCIGLFFDDAKWLNNNLQQHARKASVVIESYAA